MEDIPLPAYLFFACILFKFALLAVRFRSFDTNDFLMLGSKMLMVSTRIGALKQAMISSILATAR